MEGVEEEMVVTSVEIVGIGLGSVLREVVVEDEVVVVVKEGVEMDASSVDRLVTSQENVLREVAEEEVENGDMWD